MAHDIVPIVRNAVKFPRQTAANLTANPYLLRDETTNTVGEVAKALVRAGMRSDVMALAEDQGIDAARRAVIRSACAGHRVH